MTEPVLISVIAQIGAVIAAALAAWAARGARTEAKSAKHAAVKTRNAGQVEHSDHTNALQSLEDKLDREFETVRRDVAGLRSDVRQTRVELHDVRKSVDTHINRPKDET